MPFQWYSNTGSYTHTQISKLVVFYNDDFGIDRADLIDARKNKFRNWLTGEEREV